MIDDEITRLMQKCISCGKCTQYCPANKYGGVDPHEIMVGGDDDVSTCVLCGTCSKICRRTDPFTVMRDLKALATDAHVSDTYRSTSYVMNKADHPSRTELTVDWDGDDVFIMPGCVVECKAPFLEYATAVAVKSVGKTCTELKDAGCCLRPIQFREMTEFERRDGLLKMSSQAKGKELITLCGGCTDSFEDVGEEAPHLIKFLYDNKDRLPKFKRSFRVAMEPGCSCMHLKKEMAEVIAALGCETVGNDMGCCGKDTPLYEAMMADREKECGNGCLVVVGCPKCFTKYDAQPDGMPVVYIGELVAMAAGDMSTLKYHAIPVEPDKEEFYKPRFEGYISKETKGYRW